MKAEIHTSIDEIEPQQWNRLVEDGNPLIRHEFLAAMEHHGCVGEHFGWLPRHIALYDAGELVAAMPLYEKHNSYGEFVFDHQWESAWQRSGRSYFPKLVSAVPYTPATGQRMLFSPGDQAGQKMLADTAVALAGSISASGVHILFPTQSQQQQLGSLGWLSRRDVQFHWHNHEYADFDDFLSRLTARKRKMIRKEREAVARSGVTLRQLDGHSASHADWQDFTRFYEKTFDEKWGLATFNLDFFEEVAQQLPDNIILVLADFGGECIAGSLMYCSDTTLYGRHWGCIEQIDRLHFEACYYQGIEFCIRRGLASFEPGAQGEHKIPRGFLPVTTTSAHWINDDQFREPLRQWTRHEQAAVAAYQDELHLRSPYREDNNQ